MEELFSDRRTFASHAGDRGSILGCETFDVKIGSYTAKRSVIGVSVTGLRKWLILKDVRRNNMCGPAQLPRVPSLGKNLQPFTVNGNNSF